MAEKAVDWHPGTPNPIFINVGGDVIPGTPIPGLPYADGGNTCQFVNNYDAVCPYTGSTSPDVVYSFTPAVSVDITVDICGSAYDSKLYILNAQQQVICCNDDGCGSDGFKSIIECCPLTGGSTYYIVVDGYFGDCGTYSLVASECTPCFVECPPGGVLEGEPVCGDNYQDHHNGGCNSTPPVFTQIPCDPEGAAVTVCGEYGGYSYFGLSYRDTDWYQINLTQPSNISWCVTGEYDTLLGIIDGNAGCPVSFFYDYTFSGPCQQACLNAALPAGTWWFFAATSGFGSSAGACGGDYNAVLTGYVCEPVSVEAESWGNIKNLYR
jgi:hypothetical protein